MRSAVVGGDVRADDRSATVAKLDHHGNSAMCEKLVAVLRSQVYVGCIWDWFHVDDAAMNRKACGKGTLVFRRGKLRGMGCGRRFCDRAEKRGRGRAEAVVLG